MVMPVGKDPTEEKNLVQFLSEKDIEVTHGGQYNEYVFYTAKLTEEEFIYSTLRFGPTVWFIESVNESMNDIIIRIFNAGHKPRLSS